MGHVTKYRKTIEVTGIEVTQEKGKITIIAVYRSSSEVMHDFVTHLTEISEQVVQKYRIYYPSG
jgi:hypothetical protein